jgi:hypothetical protein
VTFIDQAEAAALRDALVDHKIENVMLVSAFLAAAALAQTVGEAAGRARTALLFVEPDTATLAVVDSADGSIADMHRVSLADDDVEAVAGLTKMISAMDRSEARPGGIFVVGTGGVDISVIKPELDAATSLPVGAPEEPELALARGAALASAHAPLFSSSTQALAWAKDLRVGEVGALAAGLGYAYLSAGDDGYDATAESGALAYSAVSVDDHGSSASPDVAAGTDDAIPQFPELMADPQLVDSRLLDFSSSEAEQGRKPFLVTGSALAALFVVGVVSLVIALAISMRPTAPEKPNAGGNVVVPARPSPPPKAQAPAPPPSAHPPASSAPPPQAPPSPPKAPAPPPKAPAPPPAAPAPAPAPAAPPPPAPVIPPIIPQLRIPGLPGGPPNPGHHEGDGWGHDGWGHGGWGHGGGHHGGGHGHGRGGGGIPIPIPIPGVHIPGL